ncbi:MAG: rane protein, major facilitator superfamily [Holophagaceae bacterium]|nr:rane protein, major facilitator superfamily [Holophagaceae bacterium]
MGRTASIFISCWFFTGVNDLTPGYLAIKPPIGLGYGPVLAGKLMGLYQMFFMLGGLLVGFILEKIFRESARTTMGLGFLISGVLAGSLLFGAVCSRISMLSLVLPATAFFAAWVVPTIVAFISINYHHSVVGRITGIAFGIGFSEGIPGILLVQFLPSPKKASGTVKGTDEAMA